LPFVVLPQKYRAGQVVVKGSGALMGAFPHTGQVMQRQEVKDFHLSCVRGHPSEDTRTTSALLFIIATSRQNGT